MGGTRQAGMGLVGVFGGLFVGEGDRQGAHHVDDRGRGGLGGALVGRVLVSAHGSLDHQAGVLARGRGPLGKRVPERGGLVVLAEEHQRFTFERGHVLALGDRVDDLDVAVKLGREAAEDALCTGLVVDDGCAAPLVRGDGVRLRVVLDGGERFRRETDLLEKSLVVAQAVKLRGVGVGDSAAGVGPVAVDMVRGGKFGRWLDRRRGRQNGPGGSGTTAGLLAGLSGGHFLAFHVGVLLMMED